MLAHVCDDGGPCAACFHEEREVEETIASVKEAMT
ncbi:hypothetical protein KHO57_gp085 [Mycobacterium phage Phabba]|uniref:Uncharacterized protein n=1 Tax=Mycobacterium phage Phabba TaxID=2027899 RepID=A0A249XSV4_9CAUD|nr:hypothetical protein KHO57_gp085 [Mycobacterium phage Phabba]ASZ74819.1 hypothetical protein SEA_PHABBA_282 [Mycobacterium phage Phabba]